MDPTEVTTLSLDELRSKEGTLREEVIGLADMATTDMTPEQSARFAPAIAEFEVLREARMAREVRDQKVAQIRASTTEVTPGIPEFQAGRKVDPFSGDVRTATRGELRDRALKAVETEGRHLAPFQADHIDKLLRTRREDCDGAAIARMLLTSETEGYRSAFMKAVTHTSPAYNPEEVRAIEEFRAANEGTPSAGGFGIPVLIDPTIVLSSGAVEAPILAVARVITITTDAWKGVAAPGVAWAYQAEAAAVTDGAVTLTQPNIPVYMARGFIPYSIELGQDYPGFADEMSKVLSQGYVDILALKTMKGTGTNQPTGIFTAMQNATNPPAHSTVTTAGTLGAVDVRATWGALPERWRPGASWVMNVTVEELIRAFGNGLALSDFTVNLTAEGTSVLMGKPVILTDYAPSFTGTTGPASYAVVGDFQQYAIVQRAGMTVELVNHLFDQATGRPTGQRGWFAYARNGADVVVPNAFRLISNT